MRAEPWMTAVLRTKLGEQAVAVASAECAMEQFDLKGGETGLVQGVPG